MPTMIRVRIRPGDHDHHNRDRPVLTIFGERNDPFGFQDRHHATFPDHESLILTKGNHFPMMDDADLFANTVRDWMNRTSNAA